MTVFKNKLKSRNLCTCSKTAIPYKEGTKLNDHPVFHIFILYPRVRGREPSVKCGYMHIGDIDFLVCFY